ncbi:hypothetical protein MRX96_053337 [Rhipicephalus microplus]
MWLSSFPIPVDLATVAACGYDNRQLSRLRPLWLRFTFSVLRTRLREVRPRGDTDSATAWDTTDSVVTGLAMALDTPRYGAEERWELVAPPEKLEVSRSQQEPRIILHGA